MEDLGFIGVMLMMAIFGFVIIMLADEISYLMTEELDDEEEFLSGIDDPDDPELKVVRPENDKNENKKNEDVSNEDEDK